MKEINKIRKELNERITALVKERDALVKEYMKIIKTEEAGTFALIEKAQQIADQEKLIDMNKNYLSTWPVFVEKFLEKFKEKQRIPDYDFSVIEKSDIFIFEVCCNKHVLTVELWGAGSREICNDLTIRWNVHTRRFPMPASCWYTSTLSLDDDAPITKFDQIYDKLIGLLAEKEKPIKF